MDKYGDSFVKKWDIKFWDRGYKVSLKFGIYELEVTEVTSDVKFGCLE